MGRIFVHGEKLGTRTVGHHASRHGNDAARVLEIVRGKAVHAEFACNGISGSSHAAARRVAALDHKSRNDAVKTQSVVKPAVGERNKVVDRIRRFVGI